MSRKDFVVSEGKTEVSKEDFDKIQTLSKVVSATNEEETESSLDKMIKELIFMGNLTKEVKVGSYTFLLQTLTEERQRVLVSRIMRMNDQEKIAYAKVYTVAEAVIKINDFSINDIAKNMFPEEENVEISKINFFGRLQATIIDLIFEEYEKLLKKSKEEIGYEEVKK